MALLFDITGDDLDQAFIHLRDPVRSFERATRDALEAMWAKYEPYADEGFREGFAQDVDARFWEMALGCTMLDAGKTLLRESERPRAGGRPDLCVIEGDRRIWIEAIAPNDGVAGPDQFRRPVPINQGGHVTLAPNREAQLRISGAFYTKSQAIDRYLRDGVIGPDDVRIIAINGGRFGPYISDQPLPIVLKTLFPIGEEYVVLDRETGDVVEQGFRHSPEIQRAGSPVPRYAFLAEQFANVSGVLWSRVSINEMSRRLRPFIYVHNPLARQPLPGGCGPWDREFVATRVGDGWEASDILAQPTEAPAA